jgi:two-component system, sensor histidine kinase and response regulator
MNDSSNFSPHPAREPLAEPALARLRRLGGEAVVRRIFSIVLEQVPERLAVAEHGLTSRNFEAIRHTAHSLRSSAANVGATRLQELARELEENLVQDNHAEAAPGLARLIAEWNLVREQLLEHLED